MTFTSPAPEAGASTNFATWALKHQARHRLYINFNCFLSFCRQNIAYRAITRNRLFESV
jgi:hypothetical protein